MFDCSHVTSYMTNVMLNEKKLGAGSCRKFLSMCSETHTVWFPQGPKLAELHLIKRLREGLTKRHGAVNVKQKPATYFSVFQLFQHVSTMTTNDETCSLQQLRDKLIVLLTIDCMARISDIETIARESLTANDEKAQFHFYFTKEEKGPREIPAYVMACPQNPLICTVTVLRHYVARTAGLPIQQIERKINGRMVQRTPLLLAEHKTDGVYLPIGRDRIRNIAKTAMLAIGVNGWKPHGIRGASSSKVVNLMRSRRPDVCMRARWASEKTFMSSYFKECHYNEANRPEFRDWSLERILRFQATRVGGL